MIGRMLRQQIERPANTDDRVGSTTILDARIRQKIARKAEYDMAE